MDDIDLRAEGKEHIVEFGNGHAEVGKMVKSCGLWVVGFK
jgi:hypothetical protein